MPEPPKSPRAAARPPVAKSPARPAARTIRPTTRFVARARRTPGRGRLSWWRVSPPACPERGDSRQDAGFQGRPQAPEMFMRMVDQYVLNDRLQAHREELAQGVLAQHENVLLAKLCPL